MGDGIAAAVQTLVDECHGASFNAGWWTDLKLGVNMRDPDYMRQYRLVTEKLCLIHSEVSEAMEGYRKDLMDDKLPHRKMIEVELADALIRICDLAGAMELDLGGAVSEKMDFNARRPDHQLQNRLKEGGKKF